MLKTLEYTTLAALLPLGLAAQEQGHSRTHQGTEAAEFGGDGMTMEMGMPSSRDPVVAARQRINLEMHAAMSIHFSGDPDTDFIRGMIPHHQGAIEMAKLLLEHGKHADTRNLATDIIRAQEEEIVLMQEWLAARAE